MTQFVKTDDGGWVNLDHVVRVGGEREDKWYVTLWGAGEEKLGVCDRGAIEEGVIVPAAAGVFVSVVYNLGGGRHERPKEENVWVARYPVAAWRVSEGQACPVLFGDGDDGGIVLLELPDGRLDQPYGGTFAGLAEATRVLLQRAQEDWDREHKGEEQ